MLTFKQTENWLKQYKQAWELQDVDLIASLFAKDARYVVNPFSCIFNSRDEISQSWVNKDHKEIVFDYQIWSVSEQTAMVHWEAALTKSDGRYVMDGVFRLIFEENEDSLCSLLEEWWFIAPQAG